MSIELVPLCTADITLGEHLVVGQGPAGFRILAEIQAATFEGERLRGTAKGQSGGDWLTIVDGVQTIDVRMTLETHDGALVHVTYQGRSDAREGPGTRPIYTAPLFETGDERYAWLNLVQAVAKGRFEDGHVHYEIAEVR